jgi:hypothetical protein
MCGKYLCKGQEIRVQEAVGCVTQNHCKHSYAVATRSHQSLPKNGFGKKHSGSILTIIQYKRLEVLRDQMQTQMAIMVQKIWRMWVCRRYYKKLRHSTLIAQACTRRWLARRLYVQFQDAALTLQACKLLLLEPFCIDVF